MMLYANRHYPLHHHGFCIDCDKNSMIKNVRLLTNEHFLMVSCDCTRKCSRCSRSIKFDNMCIVTTPGVLGFMCFGIDDLDVDVLT